MALLTVSTVNRAGLDLAAAVAASVSGDQWVNTGREFVFIKNGGGGAITVTLVFSPTALVDGQSATARTVVLDAGEENLIGPFPTAQYNDASGRMNLTYSGVTSVTVLPCVLRVPS